MKLYGNIQSACTRTVLMVCAEKNATLEIVTVDLSKGEHKTSGHISINPFGKIPVLEVDGLFLYESNAICSYLDDVLPGQKLSPIDAVKRAVMNKWLNINNCYFTPNAYTVVLQKIFLPMYGQQTDDAAVNDAIEKLKPVFSAMEEDLSRSTYLADENVTLADIVLVQYTDFLLKAGCEKLVFEHENVRRWWHSMSQRSSYNNVDKYME